MFPSSNTFTFFFERFCSSAYVAWFSGLPRGYYPAMTRFMALLCAPAAPAAFPDRPAGRPALVRRPLLFRFRRELSRPILSTDSVHLYHFLRILPPAVPLPSSRRLLRLATIVLHSVAFLVVFLLLLTSGYLTPGPRAISSPAQPHHA